MLPTAMPARSAELGLTERDVDEITSQAQAQAQAQPYANPRSVTVQALRSLLIQALKGTLVQSH
jgi:maleylacetate reductase